MSRRSTIRSRRQVRKNKPTKSKIPRRRRFPNLGAILGLLALAIIIGTLMYIAVRYKKTNPQMNPQPF